MGRTAHRRPKARRAPVYSESMSVSDEDVEAYLNHASRKAPPARGGHSQKGATWEPAKVERKVSVGGGLWRPPEEPAPVRWLLIGGKPPPPAFSPPKPAGCEGAVGPEAPPHPKRRADQQIDPATGVSLRTMQHRRLKEEGLCVSCREPRDSAESAVYCKACLEKRKGWTAARRARVRER